jgi:hypothetical protein
MYELSAEYLTKLEELAVGIQDSPALASYLNSEEEEDYNELKNNFEPSIAEVYHEVATNAPLQLIALCCVVMLIMILNIFVLKNISKISLLLYLLLLILSY